MQKREKIRIISIIAIVFMSLLSAYFLFSDKVSEEIILQATENQKIETDFTKEPSETKVTTENNQAVLEISGVRYQDEIAKNTSVYDLMDKLRSNGEINFKNKTYIGMGKFIEEINGVRGNGSEFWIYYVNGKKATIGVSNYKINPGDVVSWRYEKETN